MTLHQIRTIKSVARAETVRGDWLGLVFAITFAMVGAAASPSFAQFGPSGIAKSVQDNDARAVRQDLVNGQSPNARTADGVPVLIAAINQDAYVIAQLLLAEGARTGDRDRAGETALTAATRRGNAEIVKLLLAAGADPNLAGPRGETPLMIAAVTGNTNIVQALINAGVNVDTGDYTGSSPLAEAERRGHRRIAEILRKAGATQ